MRKDFVILASESPRRQALLRQIGVAFEVRAPAVAEVRRAHEAPAEFVDRIAKAKAETVWGATAALGVPVVGADTVVVIDGDVLGKPGTRARAIAMLERLSGRTHEVLTAVAVRHERRTESLVNASKVRFRATTAGERAAYCESGEPLDKAGAYGIQGLGAVFVEDLRGSYSGVMGLPLHETARLLARFSIPAWLCAADDGYPATAT
jgi:septum formation protein